MDKLIDESGVQRLPVAPDLRSNIFPLETPTPFALVDRRTVLVCVAAIVVGVVAAFVAEALVALIGFFTNLFFYGRISLHFVDPWGHRLGVFVIAIPVAGALLVGLIARYGSKAVRGHGIPEAMEQVLTNRSRIPARISFLKPLSAAISIGTGGPFGAEGPIIATGGALGSLMGQFMTTTASERKTLLAAGAAAGMAATFLTPVSAVLLAVELLLFEFRPRSLIPVAFASVTATIIRTTMDGAAPMFSMETVSPVGLGALAMYALIGCALGLIAMLAAWAVYAVEDGFEHLPLHWMWWPAIGAVAVGVVGYFMPRTLGVGYSNLSELLSGKVELSFVAALTVLKFISWAISLGSGTSGGTLAPLFTIGGGLGTLLGASAAWFVPAAGIDVRVAALVGMAALFAGASRAFLASVVFAFECTQQQATLLPLLAGCAGSYLVSCLFMRQSMMTEKIARRGVHVPGELAPDPLDTISLATVAVKKVVSLRAEETVGIIRQWIASSGPGTSHQGFPVVDEAGLLKGLLTRRDLLSPESGSNLRASELIRRPPVVVYSDCTLRQAVDHMVRHDIGRLPVVDRRDPGRVVGIVTRSDILSAYRRRVDENVQAEPNLVATFRKSKTTPA